MNLIIIWHIINEFNVIVNKYKIAIEQIHLENNLFIMKKV